MSKLWSQLVQDLDPYVPGEQPRGRTFVKLNTNENPYPPSARVAERIREFNCQSLRRYPDPSSQELKSCLAKSYQLNDEQVFVGNGSDEVLAFAFFAFFKKSAPLLFPDITYSFYRVYCSLFEIDYQPIPLDEHFTIKIDDYEQPNGGIIIANPNAPTGLALPISHIEHLVQRHPNSVVVIDEAYVDFGAESAVILVNKYSNLLVTHTFSKSRSLAGIRLGYAIGDADLIQALETVKNSFNCYPIDSLASVSAIATLEDDGYFQSTCEKISEDREWFTDQLTVRGFTTLPSKANFVFTTHPTLKASALYHALKEKGVLVRHFDKPRINNFLRITIGTRNELQSLLDALPAGG